MASTETILDAVKTRIASQFETHRAALAAELAATIPTYKALEKFDVLNPEYPSIEILPSSTDVEYYDGQIYDEGMEETGLTLRVTMADFSPSVVGLLLLRYREILKRIVKADPTFGGTLYRVRMGKADWAIMTKSQEAQKIAQELYQDLRVLTEY